MAIYSTGTFSSAATPAGSLVTVIANAIGQHANWSLVDTYTDANGYTHSVYKCSGTGNSAGADFYVGIVRNSTTASSVYMEAYETYNPATHQYTRPVPYAPSTSAVYTPTNVYTASETPQTLNFTGTALSAYAGNHQLFVGSVNGAFDYWVIVTSNGLMVMTRVATSVYTQYFGLFDSLVSNPSVNDPVPLCGIDPTDTSQNGPTGTQIVQNASRAPLVSAVARANVWGLYGAASTAAQWTPPATAQSSTIQGDLLQAGVPTASRCAVIMAAGSTYGISVVGYLRGLYKDILRLTGGSGATTGDTIVINGHTYLYLQSNVWFDTQAA